MCISNEDTAESFTNIFLRKYKDQFGFTLPDRPIITDDIRVRTLAKSAMSIDRKIGSRPNDKSLKESKVNQILIIMNVQENFLIESQVLF